MWDSYPGGPAVPNFKLPEIIPCRKRITNIETPIGPGVVPMSLLTSSMQSFGKYGKAARTVVSGVLNVVAPGSGALPTGCPGDRWGRGGRGHGGRPCG